jgi:Homeodomain-like domain-containing protein
MHALELRGRALELIAAGLNDCEIGRRLGVARTTVCHWRWVKERDAPPRNLCWRCWQAARRVELAAADYAELLGLYLGDGHISLIHAASACVSPWMRDTRPSSRSPKRSCDASSRSAGSAAGG